MARRRKEPEMTREMASEIIAGSLGVTLEELGKLSVEQQVELAYSRGLAFAGNVTVIGDGGKAITSAPARKVTRQ